MNELKKILCIIFVFMSTLFAEAKTVYDKPDVSILQLFNKGKSKYIIQYVHQFRDTLRVPYGCEIQFEGGQLCGPIVFDNTTLSGNVRLQGSSIRGRVSNSSFNASWLCAMDGVSDDALCINEIINVCDNVFFPRGIYRLISVYNTKGQLPKSYESEIRTHIGINKSNVSLMGEEGTTFISDNPICIISLFSQPYSIDQSISNIQIRNIVFDALNDGESFNEFAHIIRLVGVKGLLIKGCTFNRFWGDAISFSHYGDTPVTGERTRNQDVKVINNFFWGGEHHNNRNAISIVSGQNVLIKKNVFRRISRSDMPGVIDIEPNNSAYTIDKIRIERNEIDECFGMIGAIGIQFLYEGTSGKRIKVLSNIIRRSSYGLGIAIGKGSVTSDFVIKKNIVFGDTRPYMFYRDGNSINWIISGNKFEMKSCQDIPGAIKVRNLIVNHNKQP